MWREIAWNVCSYIEWYLFHFVFYNWKLTKHLKCLNIRIKNFKCSLDVILANGLILVLSKCFSVNRRPQISCHLSSGAMNSSSSTLRAESTHLGLIFEKCFCDRFRSQPHIVLPVFLIVLKNIVWGSFRIQREECA